MTYFGFLSLDYGQLLPVIFQEEEGRRSKQEGMQSVGLQKAAVPDL